MAAIALDHLIKSLEIAHGLGEAIPGGSIVKAVAAVGLVIVKAAEAVRVNKEQCLEIAQRVAEHIFTIKEGLDDGGLPMGFEERLQDYCSVLEDIARTIERVGKIGWMKRSFKHATVAEETQKCLKKLDDAYKNIMLRSSLTTMSLVNRNLTANMISYDTANLPTGPSESDELPRIPSRHIHFSGTEISRSSRAGYILGLYDGHLEVSGAQRRKVLIRKYEMMADGSQAGFERELLVRRDMLHPNVTRLLGYSVVSQRTKMIIVEAGTTPATSYLSSLPPLDHFFESWRLMNELAKAYEFFHDHGASWEGGLQDLNVSTRGHHIQIGGAGSLDDYLDASVIRLWSATSYIRDGTEANNTVPADNKSSQTLHSIAETLREGFEVTQAWKANMDANNALRLLGITLGWMKFRPFEPYLQNNSSFSIGDIGWVENNLESTTQPYTWHRAPIVNNQTLASHWQQSLLLKLFHEDQGQMFFGEYVEGLLRWELPFRPDKMMSIGTTVNLELTTQSEMCFRTSCMRIAEHMGVDVSQLRIVRKMSKVLRTVFKIGNTSENIPSTIYYFSHPVTSEGNIQVPPGFWSFYPDPSVDAATRLNRHEAHHTVRLHKFTYYGSLGASHLALLRGIDSYGCLPAHDVVFEDQPRSKVQKATAGPRSMLSRARRLLK